MATVDSRDDYRFCGIEQGLVVGKDVLMPNRPDKNLLVGCDIAFLMEGAAERMRVASSYKWGESDGEFKKSMDKTVRRDRIQDVQRDLRWLADKDVNTLEGGRNVGGYINLPLMTILSAESPASDKTIKEAHPELRIDVGKMTRAEDVTSALRREPIQRLFGDLNTLTCCERYVENADTKEVYYPDQTKAEISSVSHGELYPDPDADVETYMKDNKMALYAANTTIATAAGIFATDPDAAVENASWTTTWSQREWYSDEQDYVLRIRPFRSDGLQPSWYYDLVDKCVCYAQIEIKWWNIDAVESDRPGYYQAGFSEVEKTAYYWPMATEKLENGGFAVYTSSLRQAVASIKGKLGWPDKTEEWRYRRGDKCALYINVVKFRPVYYLTDRTTTASTTG